MISHFRHINDHLTGNCVSNSDKVDTHWRHGGGMKDAGMRIRVEQDLREEFIAACQTQHTPAAQVLRQFMRGYVEQTKAKAIKAHVVAKTKKTAG